MSQGGRDSRRAGNARSHGPPRGFRWTGEREVDWTDTADCDDCRLILAANHSVVVRSSSHAANEAAGRRRHPRTKSTPPLTHQAPETTTQNRSVV